MIKQSLIFQTKQGEGNSLLQKKEPFLVASVVLLLVFSNVILRSVAGYIFPSYWVYIVIGVLAFIFFASVDFDIFTAFSWHLYILSVVLLLLPLIIGEVTRGAVRWIPLGSYTLQPAEIVRPFLILFFAKFMTQGELTTKRFLWAVGLLMVPLVLILLQPSLGVSVLTGLGFAGVLLSCDFNKKVLLTGVILFALYLPFSWFLLAPYQKLRVKALFMPESDPYGVGYNSMQSMISVGSGKLFGRGIGEGVQTQLRFLPEMQTDFIFASVAEENGFFGAAVLMGLTVILLYRVIAVAGAAKNVIARSYASGVFLTMFAQVMVHVGMNMGIMPITGIPLPLVSVGGSSLLATMMMLGLVVGAKK